MKIHFPTLFIIGLFILLAYISLLLSCPLVQPYSPEMMYRGMYPYEGFRNNESSTSYPDYKLMDDGKVDDSSPLKKVIGFNGLLSSPDYVAEPNDFLSKVEGSPDCRSHSYGYTNSRGFICMNPEQVKLLTTRGGNA